MEIGEARRVIKIYREANWKINKLWRDAQQILVSLNRNDMPFSLGKGQVLRTVPEENAIKLPSGLLMRYEDLDYESGEMGEEFSYQTRRGRTRIYGGKVVENVCQAIARCIIGEQMLLINKKHRVVLTVHDSIATCVKDEEVEDAQTYIEECMRWTPDWAEGLPINCESGTGKTYGDCE
jgi:DNA polymerase